MRNSTETCCLTAPAVDESLAVFEVEGEESSSELIPLSVMSTSSESVISNTSILTATAHSSLVSSGRWASVLNLGSKYKEIRELHHHHTVMQLVYQTIDWSKQ